MVIPKYSGKMSEWPNFQKRWEGYISAYLPTTDNRTLLEVLRNCLDRPSVDLLEYRLSQDPYMGYQQFWGELVDEMS
jgi:hypothetical protein